MATTAEYESRASAAVAAAAAAAAGGRRKGSTIRAWLVVTDTGRSYVEEAGKHSIMRRTGLPARDLRILDPLLSYPSTILGRERAIVINLEHIKAVITATEVLVPNSKDPIVAPFIHDLLLRVSPDSDDANPKVSGGFEVEGDGIEEEGRSRSGLGNDRAEDGGERFDMSVPTDGTAAKVLAFEFRALEVCLEFACKCLESETLTLEEEAYPALDELTSKISALNLERVRQIKSRLVAISGRVQKVRDELEHLLDDDSDMAEMYLTAKTVSHRAGEASTRIDVDEAFELGEKGEDDMFENDSESSNKSLGDFKPNIEELEMLLEAYFVQTDCTLHKLSTLREYVCDTEDYINIMLDEKQNQLLQMGIKIGTATLVSSAGIVVVSVFGMNINISMFDENASYKPFWHTTIGTIVGCIVLYVIAMFWGKKSGLY